MTLPKSFYLFIILVVLFIVVSAPFMYEITGFLTNWAFKTSDGGVPNVYGLILHALVLGGLGVGACAALGPDTVNA
jgi:hypothetical protein